MKILILGGTGFLGPHTVEAATARGHTLTLFNRGKTHPGLFPDIEQLHGDRKVDLSAIENEIKKGRTWDAVVDNSGYVPKHVKMSAELLKPAAKQYIFVSTVSVYGEITKPVDEDSPVDDKLDDPETEKVGQFYGQLKARCEVAAAEAFGKDRTASIRPGLIVGPGDETDRFSWWPWRIDKGGTIIAPGVKENPVQFIDVRDLGEWIVKMVEDGHSGTYNALGPGNGLGGDHGDLSMAEFLYGIRAVTPSKVKFIWMPEQFLEEQHVGPWMEMPLWIPGEGNNMHRTRNDRAVAHGLKFRPLADTARDTLEWVKTKRPADKKWGAGLAPEKEAAVLKAWSEK